MRRRRSFYNFNSPLLGDQTGITAVSERGLNIFWLETGKPSKCHLKGAVGFLFDLFKVGLRRQVYHTTTKKHKLFL